MIHFLQKDCMETLFEACTSITLLDIRSCLQAYTSFRQCRYQSLASMMSVVEIIQELLIQTPNVSNFQRVGTLPL